MRKCLIAWGVVLAALLPASAMAQLIGPVEVRGGVYANDVNTDLLDPTKIEDVNVELLVGLPTLDALSPLGSIRPHIGATVNTNEAGSLAYGGLSWTVPLGMTPFFAEVGAGAAVQGDALDDAIASASDPGCRLRVRGSASLGVRLTESIGVMGTVDHTNPAGLCDSDVEGRTQMGVRLGWKF